MQYFKEVNLPPIPKDLLDFDYDDPEITELVFNIERFDYNHDNYLNGEYLEPPSYNVKRIHHLSLETWLKQYITIPFNIVLSTVKQKDNGRMIIHTDRNRSCALNYTIDCGGDNVSTNWYGEKDQPIVRPEKNSSQTNTGDVRYENCKLLDTVRSFPNKWYLIRTDVLHDVENINGSRILLQIQFNNYNYSDNFEELSALFK